MIPDPTSNPCTPTHPAWCDLSPCTASWANGLDSRAGGQHRSIGFPLNLRAGMWPIPPHAVAFLSEAVALWRCSTFLRITVDSDTDLAMPVEYAAPLLSALSELVASGLAES